MSLFIEPGERIGLYLLWEYERDMPSTPVTPNPRLLSIHTNGMQADADLRLLEEGKAQGYDQNLSHYVTFRRTTEHPDHDAD